jgi:diaminopimelate decarboxylase
MEDYESDGGRMLFAGMYVSDIAREFGTPVYVTDKPQELTL